MHLLIRLFSPLATLMAGLVSPGSAQELPCQLCSTADQEDRRQQAERAPLRIDVETSLDFSRVTQTGPGEGEIALDPKSGERKVSGALTDLGGMSLRGSAVVKGQPNQPVLITLPNRVQLNSSTGSVAEITDIRSDLGPAPSLDADGQLRFTFGGRLRVTGRVSGVFRGSIPITADYP
jgi:Domain of unknown function (DUF4402)